MKTSSNHRVKSAKRSAQRVAKKPAAKRVRSVRGDAVALAMGRALMRKPKVNPVLLKMMRRNRDLLPL